MSFLRVEYVIVLVIIAFFFIGSFLKVNLYFLFMEILWVYSFNVRVLGYVFFIVLNKFRGSGCIYLSEFKVVWSFVY